MSLITAPTHTPTHLSAPALSTALSGVPCPPVRGRADLSPLALDLGPDATHLRIVAWTDPADAGGHDHRSAYVERFWLGVIGPSCTWMMRLIGYGFEAAPDGFTLPLADTARALGMGDRLGRASPFVRALGRLCQFDLAAPLPDGSLAVRTAMPWLSRRMIAALPAGLRDEHRSWEIAAGGLPARPPLVTTPLPGADQEATLAEHRRRAAELALSVARTGADANGVERALGRWRFHPALSRHLAEWAVAAVAGNGPAGTDGAEPEMAGLRPLGSAAPAR